MKAKITILVLAFLLVLSQNNFAQNTSSLWTKVENSSFTTSKMEFPVSYQLYQLNLNLLQKMLQQAPLRNSTSKSSVIISFPSLNGILEQYAIFEAPVFHPDLAAKYPNIKSYFGKGMDNPTSIIRFSVSPQKGLSSTLISGDKKTTFIESYSDDLSTYAVYSRTSEENRKYVFECLTTDVPLEVKKLNPSYNKDANDQKLRTFRLALSSTGEYTTFHGGTKAGALAAMNATMTRVNGVYETDFGITMVLIANNDTIIFTNSASDPYTNNLNSQLQTTLNNYIQNANYDIGHLVHQETNSNGNAGCIGCVCVDGQKGSGFTSHITPQGDDFDMDFVAHEMGHQFGGNHSWTFNGSEGSGAQMEPGSGSTIMGYAGITGASDVQPHSDDYFHFFNIQQITTNVAGKTCYTTTTIVNTPPTAMAGIDYVIPKGTAFVLEGAGSDTDADSLSFCWEQANVGFNSVTNVSATSTTGPAFRSLPPTLSTKRYFPKLASVVAGTLTTQWETVSNVGRTMNFALTVRDNLSGGGQNKIDQMVVTVNGTAGPFVVTSQNTTGITLNSGASTPVTWNVAGTTSAPVSTANVDIFLSTDGGFTYPVTLATGVPNNGTANITIPTGNVTTTGRIMVRGSGNIFYAINSKNFAIQDAEFVMNFSNTTSSNCPTVDAVYNFTYNTFLGFNESTTFSATGQPVGSIVTFNPTSASADSTPVQVTISGLNASMVGTYSIDITGTATSVTKLATVTLDVINPTPTAANLTSPVNLATGVDPATTFTWSSGGVGAVYNIDIATDSAFTSIVDIAIGLSTNSYNSSVLTNTTTYYWRVTTYNNCGSAPASSVFSFTTSSCAIAMSTDIPKTIPATAPPINVISTLNIPTSGTISDLNVVDLIGTHTWINDLVVSIKSPAGTTVTLWSAICNDEDNFNVNFDDAAAPGALPCPPVGGGTYQPNQALSVFNGQNQQGTWTLTVSDMFNQDGGTLTSWGLNICSDIAPTGVTAYAKVNEIKIYPNPTSDMVTVDLGDISTIDKITLIDLQGKVLYQNININKNSIKIDVSQFSNGFYILQVQGKDSNNAFKVLKQ